MGKKIFTAIIALSITLYTSLLAQDTLKILQYNLLYYGDTTTYCTTDNNDMATKTNYLKTIISYVKPDIFGVNEINTLTSVHDYLLNNVFILNGFSNYKRSEVLGDPGYITTQVFYNSDKLEEVRVYSITAWPRSILVHKFYLKTRSLRDGDTIWLYVAEAHLKAGTDSSDALDRANATANLMAFIQDNGVNNYIFMGDFNLYTSAEDAYQNVVNPSNPAYKFYDPGPAGNWSNNSYFAAYHTQSTNYYSDGCKAGGGLDDRFDFILYSAPLRDNTLGLRADSSSFKIIGNDGQHFNSSIDYNGNNSVPADVLTALKNNSDHLPVYIELITSSPFTDIENTASTSVPGFTVNFSMQNQITLQINDNYILSQHSAKLEIFSIDGKQAYSQAFTINPYVLNYTLKTQPLAQGIYVVTLKAGDRIYTHKLIKP